jgi:hypothetical protein
MSRASPDWSRPKPLECDECGRKPQPDEKAEDDWPTYYQGVGDGVTLCPESAGVIAAEIRDRPER